MLQPIISEKSIMDAQKGKFTFKMNRFMGKNAISQAVHDQFSVDVVSITTTIVKGRSKRVGTRRLEKTKTAWKKAIVKLKDGQKISVFEIGEQK